MEKHIETKKVLQAAEAIRKRGTQKDGKHYYEQMCLEISHDGYTVTVSDPKTSLTIYFHNKVKATYQRMQDLEDFYQRLCRLADEN